MHYHFGYPFNPDREPPQAPNAPTNFIASDDEVEKITFTWTNSTVGYPTPTYDIYISGGALVVSGVTSPHTEAIAQGTADYIVRAVNSEGTADSNIDSGTSLEPDLGNPVITILGSNPEMIDVGTTYVDAGATALDDVEGDVTDLIVTTSNVNDAAIGDYTVAYNCEDTSGNVAIEKVRDVNVWTPNLFSNGTFDTTTAPWTQNASPEPTWSAEDNGIAEMIGNGTQSNALMKYNGVIIEPETTYRFRGRIKVENTDSDIQLYTGNGYVTLIASGDIVVNEWMSVDHTYTTDASLALDDTIFGRRTLSDLNQIHRFDNLHLSKIPEPPVIGEYWTDITTSQAEAADWTPYGATTIVDDGDWVKLTCDTNTGCAYLQLTNISPIDNTGLFKNYEVLAKVRTDPGVTGEIRLHNLTGTDVQPSLDLTEAEQTFKYKGTSVVNNATGPMIRFDGVSDTNVIYVHKDVTVLNMDTSTRVWETPSLYPFGGSTITHNNTTDINQVFQDLEDAGAKVVRIAAIQRDQIGTKEEAMQEFVDAINNTYIPLLTQHGMTALIAYESPYTDGTLEKRDAGYWDADGGTGYNYMTDFIDCAESLASNFSSISSDVIFAYQILSEPVGDGTDTEFVWADNEPKIWYSLCEDIITKIRSYDNNKFIFMSGGLWGFSDVWFDKVPFDDNKILYNMHNYSPTVYTHQGISEDFPEPYTASHKANMEAQYADMVTYKTRNNGLPIVCGATSTAIWSGGASNDSQDYIADNLAYCLNNNIPCLHFNVGTVFVGWDARYYQDDGTATAPSTKDLTNTTWLEWISYWNNVAPVTHNGEVVTHNGEIVTHSEG